MFLTFIDKPSNAIGVEALGVSDSKTPYKPFEGYITGIGEQGRTFVSGSAPS